MPEIAEVARLVYFLRLHLVGKTIAKVSAVDDGNVFGKVGTSGPEFIKAVTGKKVESVGSQGKYFWITFDKPPHAVMHLGMTGWVHIKGERTAYTNYYKKMKEGNVDNWPPKFWKFTLVTTDKPAVEVAFTDPRRFGRVRLVDCPGANIRKHSPLVENGPDPVVDPGVFTEEYFEAKVKKRRGPIKALLLDQTVLSGVGNWVADEILFQARVHPEQFCDTFDDSQTKKLYEMTCYVTRTACELLGDSDKFPDTWLFNHRWSKGKKGPKLPTGEALAFATVGGRTSCFVPSLQKKTGRIADGVKVEAVEEDDTSMKEKPSPGNVPTKIETLDTTATSSTKRKRRTDVEEPVAMLGLKSEKRSKVKKMDVKEETVTETNTKASTPSRRRSGRLTGKSNYFA